MIDLLVLDQVQEGVNLLDSSCVLFQILIMFPTTKLVDYSDSEEEGENKMQAPDRGQEVNNNWEGEMEGPGDPDQYPGMEGRQANYPVWAPPTTLFRSLAREPVKDLVVNGVSCLLRPVRVELGGKGGKVAFVARDGVVDVAPRQMVLRKKVLVCPS